MVFLFYYILLVGVVKIFNYLKYLKYRIILKNILDVFG